MSSVSPSNTRDYHTLKAEAMELEARIRCAKTKDEALDYAFKAAEMCMQALQATSGKGDKAEMRSKCRTLLDEAEKIKVATAWTPIEVKKLTEPVSKRELTKAEKILLLRASKLNGVAFPPWTGPPGDADFEGGVFEDPAELSLSQHQMKSFDGWKRANDALPPPSWFPDDRSEMGPTMVRALPMDLVQDATTDCSVVASLCAGAARAEKGHARILSQVVFPWDTETGRPRISANGKYILRLNFNGCYRRVVIDDRLPVSNTRRLLHIIDRNNPSLLWPALLEKAYLKVRGGYDFPGSNSSTDLWTLKGWIPEQVFLQDDSTDPRSIWKRIFHAFRYGDVLVTMGTGKMSNRVEKELGLAGQHDYAVLELKEEGDQQLVLMKNPWCEGKSWKGKIPPPVWQHESSLSPKSGSPVLSALTGLEDGLSSTSISSQPPQELTPGTFWIDWNNVFQHFESIYLNWNPGLFSHRQDIHFSWDLSQQRSAVGSFASNPQFSVSATRGGTLWLLLCRHFQDATITSEETVPKQDTDRSRELIGHMSLYIYDCKGERTHISSPPLQRGPYVDSPQTLLRLDVPKPATYTVVVSEQDLPPIKHGFSLMAFSSMPVNLDKATDRFPFSSTISSAWTSSTAGGGAHTPSYSRNPQFLLQVPQRTTLTILLETQNPDFNVHVKLVHSSGKRITALASRDIIVDSGPYRHGSTFAQVPDSLDAGAYTILCSTFEAGQRAAFALRVDSDTRVALAQLPPENAGRIRKTLPLAMVTRDVPKIAVSITPLRVSRFSASARGAPVRLTLEVGRGPRRRVVAGDAEGDFVEGARVEEVDVWPGHAGGSGSGSGMFLVVEKMAGVGGDDAVVVEVGVDGRVEDGLRIGEWMRWDD